MDASSSSPRFDRKAVLRTAGLVLWYLLLLFLILGSLFLAVDLSVGFVARRLAPQGLLPTLAGVARTIVVDDASTDGTAASRPSV